MAKDKKIRMMNKHVRKEWLECHQSHENIIKKNIKKVKVKEQGQKHYKLSMYYARAIMKLIQYFLCKRQDA